MNKWIINKYGFLNFWLFDDEQLRTYNGNLLLSGENGSGKSVTLQSFIPLILDGNTSSHRLSTEGDMSRKIDFYILYGNKEENISYLYAEFMKEEMGKKIYVTFGIGFKMRRGQARPTKWYFTLKNMRIGEDIKLYRTEKNYKFAFTKQDMKKVFEEKAEGNFRLFETRQEYKTEVNNVLFGFPDIEEYEETLDLILELRKPSLKDSSGFDPKFIYEILNKSLKSLPETELLNMSESFENIEKISSDLETIKIQNRALKNIEKKYKNYNDLVLKDSLDRYISIYNESKRVKQELKNSNEDLDKAIEIIEKSNIRIEKLNYEKINKEKRILELSSNKEFTDIQNNYELVKKRIIELEDEKKALDLKLKKDKEILAKTEKNLNEKLKEKDQRLEKLKELIDKIELLKGKLSFESIIDFNDFLNLDKKMDISIIEKEFRDFEDKLIKVINNVRENKENRVKMDNLLSYKSQEDEKLFEVKKEYRELLKEIYDTKEKLIGNYKNLSDKNDVFYLNREKIGDIEEILFEDEEKSSTDKVKNYLSNIREKENNKILEKNFELKNEKNILKEKLDEKKNSKKNLEDEKDIELEISEEFVNERKKLEKGKYSEFYKTVKFKDGLDSEIKGKVEKALLDSGILGAIITKENSLEIYDKYLISSEEKENNLLNYLELEEDVFDSEVVNKILKSISIDKDNGTYIRSDGEYKIGLLIGKVRADYHAKYIGVEERKKLKEEKIKRLSDEIENYKKEIYSVELELEESKERENNLIKEFDVFLYLTKDSGIEKLDLKINENIINEKHIKNNILKWKNEIESIKDTIDKMERQINEILILNKIEINDYNSAEENLNKFKNIFTIFKSEKSIITNIINGIKSLEGNYLYQEDSYHEKLKNRNKVKIELRENEEKFKLYQEKLGNDEYKNFKEEINELYLRVNVEIPNTVKELEKKVVVREERIKTVKIKIEDYKLADQKNEKTYKIYDYLLEIELKSDYLNLNEEFKEIEDKRRLRDRLRKRIELGVNKYDCLNELAVVLNNENRILSNYHLELRNFEYDYSKIENNWNDDKGFLRKVLNGNVNGKKMDFFVILKESTENMEAISDLLNEEERRFFEDFLFNEIGRDINRRVKDSIDWVAKIDEIMNMTPTSSGKKYKLKWEPKIIEESNGMKADLVVKLLGNRHSKESYKIKNYFKSRMKQLKDDNEKKGGKRSNYELIKEILDYRNWYDFRLIVVEAGGREYNLTKKRLNSYSGGEKVMAVYIPLFSALYARFVNARKDGLKIVSMDEVFSVVDDENIEKLFGILEKLGINYLLASQKLSGTYKTVKSLAIAHIENPVSKQLVKPEDGYVSLIKYLWNGSKREKDLRGTTQKLF